MALFKKHSKTDFTTPADCELDNFQKQLKAQDKQLNEIKDAESKFEADGDINSLICFWERIWNNGGLLFNGSKWAFRLPDLYIKQKRYDDALRILKKINNPAYQEKKKSYIEKAQAAKKKEKTKPAPCGAGGRSKYEIKS